MSTSTDRRFLVISCRGVIHALYMGYISLADLHSAVFYLDCSQDDVFRDSDGLNYVISSFPHAHVGAVGMHSITRAAVKIARAQGRVAWRDPKADGWKQLNDLLRSNEWDAIGPLHGQEYSAHNAVQVALNTELPYHIIWKPLREKV